MILHPTSVQQLAESLRSAATTGTQISGYELSSLPHSINHRDDDLTVTITSNISLAELQSALAPFRQWLPIDPLSKLSPTIEQIISNNLSGSRRYGYGTIREYLIGLKVMLPDGRVVQSGGQVVKNVAGFDLCKLFVGNQRNLGIILEATFKLYPLPEAEALFVCKNHTLSNADLIINRVLDSSVIPVILDLHNLTNDSNYRSSAHTTAYRGWNVVVGFAGTTEDVAWQTDILQSIGEFSACNSDYLETAAHSIPEISATYSVLPSRTCEIIVSLPEQPVLAHVGNGIIRNGTIYPRISNNDASDLLKRLKYTFDPAGVLNIYSTE